MGSDPAKGVAGLERRGGCADFRERSLKQTRSEPDAEPQNGLEVVPFSRSVGVCGATHFFLICQMSCTESSLVHIRVRSLEFAGDREIFFGAKSNTVHS
jgi:hypothetical protein